MTHSERILVFSDELPSDTIRGALEARGFDVVAAADRDTAYRQLLESSFDLIIIDLADAQAGVEFIEFVCDILKLRDTSVLTLAEWGTGQPTLALSKGADAFEPKPVDAERLVSAVERLLRKKMTAIP